MPAEFSYFRLGVGWGSAMGYLCVPPATHMSAFADDLAVLLAHSPLSIAFLCAFEKMLSRVWP